MFQRQPQIPIMHLSFKPPVITTVRQMQWILALIALACLVFAVSFLQESRSLDEQSDYYEHASAHQHRLTQLLAEDMARTGLTLTDEQINTVRKEVAFANQLTQKRDFSWTEMLHNLENAVPSHVSIDSVRLNFQDSTIVLHGTVKTIQDLNSLVTKLDEAGAFSRVSLIEHNTRAYERPAHPSTESVSAHQSGQRSAEVIDFTLTVTYHQTL
jgi:Tfp pilus assembly protein PilN